MGIGPQILDLYKTLKQNGTLDNINSIMELGSQGVWCHETKVLGGLFTAFNKLFPSNREIAPYINDNGTGYGSSRQLHEWLGLSYQSIDLDGKWGAIPSDLNTLQAQSIGQFDLVTNHGTTEHVFNQYNAFKLIHDLTKVNGLMLHALPMTAAYYDHGFFSYQPNFFEALAKYNEYETVGMWVMPSWGSMDLQPWQSHTRYTLPYGPGVTHLLVVLHRKTVPAEFKIPIQQCYEATIAT